MGTIIEKKYLIGKNGSVVLEGDSSPYISNSINRYQARLSFETPLNSNEESLIYAIAFQSRKGIYTYLAQVENNEYYCFVPNGALVPNSYFQIGLIALDGNVEYNTEEDANGTLIEIPTGKISYKYSTLWSLPQTVLEGAFEGDEVNSTETQTLLEDLASIKSEIKDLEGSLDQKTQEAIEEINNEKEGAKEQVQSVRDSCLGDLSSVSSNASNDISEQTAASLYRIEQSRDEALSSISSGVQITTLENRTYQPLELATGIYRAYPGNDYTSPFSYECCLRFIDASGEDSESDLSLAPGSLILITHSSTIQDPDSKLCSFIIFPSDGSSIIKYYGSGLGGVTRFYRQEISFAPVNNS